MTGSPATKVKGIKESASLANRLDEQQRQKCLTGLAVAAMDHLEVADLFGVLQYLELDLTQHWTIQDEFLRLLTRSEIEFIAKEIGLAKHLGKTFSSLMSKPKEEFITSLMKSGFSFAGILPKVMKYPTK